MFFKSIEASPEKTAFPLNTFLNELSFNDQGLMPVIAQQYDTGQVLMMTWMNSKAIHQTLTTRNMTYCSRSRRAFGVKGESSGNTKKLRIMRVDYDGDTLLCLVDQVGGACHTLHSNFFNFDTASTSVVINESVVL